MGKPGVFTMNQLLTYTMKIYSYNGLLFFLVFILIFFNVI